jgi:uncharacterized small protein (DUF1192 family)
MGMSSPKTKAEAREQIAKLQGDIAREKASLAHHKATVKGPNAEYGASIIRDRIASKQAKIAKLRSQIPSLPK